MIMGGGNSPSPLGVSMLFVLLPECHRVLLAFDLLAILVDIIEQLFLPVVTKW